MGMLSPQITTLSANPMDTLSDPRQKGKGHLSAVASIGFVLAGGSFGCNLPPFYLYYDHRSAPLKIRAPFNYVKPSNCLSICFSPE